MIQSKPFLLLLLCITATVGADRIKKVIIPDGHVQEPITAHRFLTEGSIDIIVKYKTVEGKARAKKRTEERQRQNGGQSKHKKDLESLNVEVFEVSSIEELYALEDDEDVLYVEEDPKRYLFEHFEHHSVTRNLGESVPYGINLVKALSVPDTYVNNRRVCVVDTGYDLNHEDLPKASTGSSVTGTNGVNGLAWSQDNHGHGSHCAGTIAAVGDNTIGVVGVNRNGQLNLHIVRVFGTDGAWITGTSLITAVQNCRDAGSNVVSMSLGGSGYSTTEFNAFKSIYEQDGVLIIAAAGNSGTSGYSYPASYEPVMSVAAIDSNKNKASFSQFNDQVDIAAPGVGVLSTLPGNSYASWSGTSMATPHVSGVAALIWSHYPNKKATEVRAAMEFTAEDLGAVGRDDSYGHGLVRADLALDALSNGQYTDAPTISPAPSPKPTVCEDVSSSLFPDGWYDIDGPTYSCAWYAVEPRCDYYGSGYRNFGYVANEACCVCGGGVRGPPETASPTVTLSSRPTSRPSSTPTLTPSFSPSESPSSVPSHHPSASPISSPSSYPTLLPTGSPSTMPSSSPTSGPTLVPSSSPTQSIVAIVRSFAKAELAVTCPFNATAVEQSMSSDLVASLEQEGATVEVFVTILGDVSCSERRNLLVQNVDALIETEVTIRSENLTYTDDTIVNAASSLSDPSFTVSSVLAIEQPSAAPSVSPSSRPSASPTSLPTDRPSSSPSVSPTRKPSSSPSDVPTRNPSSSPTNVPTSMPSSKPSSKPSASPTNRPSSTPSVSPTRKPSASPTDVPTRNPSESPTDVPTSVPSSRPTKKPSVSPTNRPSLTPSVSPTRKPSASPSDVPTRTPSMSPTKSPVPPPTPAPTSFPTPASYKLCRTVNANKKINNCIKIPGCYWCSTCSVASGKCRPKTPAPTASPSSKPTRSPSEAPSGSVVATVSKAVKVELDVTCPFDQSNVGNQLTSEVSTAIELDGANVQVTLLSLTDASCSDRRVLQSSQVEAVIEVVVAIRDPSVVDTYTNDFIESAINGVSSETFSVASSDFIAMPSAAPSVSPTSRPTRLTAAPTASPTTASTPSVWLRCRTVNAKKKRSNCIKISGCIWINNSCYHVNSRGAGAGNIIGAPASSPVSAPVPAPVAPPTSTCRSITNKNVCKAKATCTWKNNVCIPK